MAISNLNPQGKKRMEMLPEYNTTKNSRNLLETRDGLDIVDFLGGCILSLNRR